MDAKANDHNSPGQDSQWIDAEVKGCQFPDARLDKRFRKLLGQLWDGIGCTLPLACQDWAAAKAAYRFFFK